MAGTDHTLAQVKLFQSLDSPSLRRLATECHWHRARAGEWVLDHQGPGTSVFVVVRGHLRVVVLSAQRETILGDLRDGELFGELAAIDGLPRAAGIVAVSETLLASMSAATFRRAIDEHPQVRHQVMAALAARVRALANRAGEASGLSVKHRLWAELLRLAREVRAPHAEPAWVVSPPPTHAELAARVSSHREAMTRELNALERAGLIARRRGAIVLLEPARLRQMLAEAVDR